MDFTKIWTGEEVKFFTDSSRNFSLGFGGYCNKAWFQQRWDSFTKDVNPSIKYLELYASTAGVLAWLHNFTDKHIVIFCDNHSVINMVNNTSSSCRNCMVLIRKIVLHCLIWNVKIFAKFVPTKLNAIADSLSRFQNSRFADLTAELEMDTFPTPIPQQIWPIQKIWLKNVN